MGTPRLRIVRADDAAPLSLDPESDLFKHAEPILIGSFPWQPREEFAPCVVARLAWQERALCALFEVEDRGVRCLCTEPGGPVWEDSCVELFFRSADGYFNVEINCGGTPLLAWQTGRGQNRRAASPSELGELLILSSLPPRVEPEIPGPVGWRLAVRVPFDLLRRIGPLETPEKGKKWHGNLYHCNENGSHPRWGSWAPIVTPRPDFHRPEFFGEWLFE
ncbi:MAG: carbohydrate-binding family 9-like protein [Fimbriimonadales bacterium]